MSNEPILNMISPDNPLARLPAKQKLAAIYAHDNPGELVRSLNSHDLLITINEVGAQDCLELLELLSPGQVQDILDLEIWQNDEIDPKKAGHYFSLLFAAGTDAAFAQIQGQDIELLGLIFKSVCQIYDLSEGEEPLDTNLMSLSPDRRFAVCFTDDSEFKELAESMHAFLEHLYGEDMKHALQILERIRFEMASGLEETSLRWRTGRLMDLGILPREERLEYFAPLLLNQIKPNKPVGHFAAGEVTKSLAIMPHFSTDKHTFLNLALSALNPEQQARAGKEINLAYVNMFASLSGEFGNVEKMREVCAYISALLEFGIVHQSLGKSELAKTALVTCSVKEIIRLGRTMLTTLRKGLVSVKESDGYLFGKNCSLADSPLREVARALCLPEPRFYEGLLDEAKLGITFFTSLSQVDATFKALSELKFRSFFVGPKVLGISSEQLIAHPQLSHAGIYARCLLNCFLKKDDALASLTLADHSKIFRSHEVLHADFVAHSKIFAAKLAEKMSQNSNFDLELAQTQSEHFNTSVLIQLEKNHSALIG